MPVVSPPPAPTTQQDRWEFGVEQWWRSRKNGSEWSHEDHESDFEDVAAEVRWAFAGLTNDSPDFEGWLVVGWDIGGGESHFKPVPRRQQAPLSCASNRSGRPASRGPLFLTASRAPGAAWPRG